MRVGGWNIFASIIMNSNSLICFVQGVKLLSLPRILCMNLKRFRNSRGSTHKLDCRVSFPETFDFSQSLQHAFSANFAQVHPNSFFTWILHLLLVNTLIIYLFFFQNECRYTLYAVVVHSGYAMFGHYTAYVRHRENKCWYYADDSHVQRVHQI